MCGVAGFVALREGLEPPPRATLERMAWALAHRGPDELGLYRDERAGLAHARLSIIDLAGGSQPLANEDGSLWIAFNGEVFNYLELKERLTALGHAFRTRSDTEVVVHAFEAWGEAALDRFNGQFVIALWDAARRRLLLARDRLGVRPLHLCEHAGRLWFASEAKALFAADPSIPRALDPVALKEAFTFWSPIAPRTAFAGVSELEPGELAIVENGSVTRRAWWRPTFPARGREARATVADSAARVRGALEQAVRLRALRADVPVGCYLSGGLDSSLVAALGRRAVGGHFTTFSMRFADADLDEGVHQREVARRLESDHREIAVSGRAIAETFPDVVRHAERPLLRTAPAPMFLLSRLVHDAGIKVVLTGEGADEVFAGYDLFREARVRRFWARVPASTARPRLLERLYPWLARSPTAHGELARAFFGQGLGRWREPGFSHAPRWRSAAALQRLFSPGLRHAVAEVDVEERFLASRPPDFPTWDFLAQDQWLEMRTLLAGYLLSSQGDRMLMAHSVEGRFPFLDPDVVELASALPASHKLMALDEKHVLKRAAKGLVPASILERPKQPYRAPGARSFVGDGSPEWVEAVLSQRSLADAGLFDPGAVRGLWAKCRAAVGPLSNADEMALVGVLSTQLLHRAFVAEPPNVERAGAFRVVVDRLASGESL